jgi:hypothetical protein
MSDELSSGTFSGQVTRDLPELYRCCWWLCLFGCVAPWFEEQDDTLLSQWHPWTKIMHSFNTDNHSTRSFHKCTSFFFFPADMNSANVLGCKFIKKQFPNLPLLDRTKNF